MALVLTKKKIKSNDKKIRRQIGLNQQLLYFDTKKGMNELEKRFVREGDAANLSMFFDLVLRCFTKTDGSIDLCLSLLRRYWPNSRIKLRRRS